MSVSLLLALALAMYIEVGRCKENPLGQGCTSLIETGEAIFIAERNLTNCGAINDYETTLTFGSQKSNNNYQIVLMP